MVNSLSLFRSLPFLSPIFLFHRSLPLFFLPRFLSSLSFGFVSLEIRSELSFAPTLASLMPCDAMISGVSARKMQMSKDAQSVVKFADHGPRKREPSTRRRRLATLRPRFAE